MIIGRYSQTSTSNVLRAAQHRRLWNLCQCDLLFTQGAFNLSTEKSHWLYKFIILNIKLVVFGACIYLFVCPMKVCLELTIFDLFFLIVFVKIFNWKYFGDIFFSLGLIKHKPMILYTRRITIERKVKCENLNFLN